MTRRDPASTGQMCPVCGFPALFEPPRTDEGGASYEICPSCGFEFGVTDDDRGFTYDSWRVRWVADGMPWSSVGGSRKPQDWDPAAQLAALVGPSGAGDAGAAGARTP